MYVSKIINTHDQEEMKTEQVPECIIQILKRLRRMEQQPEKY